MDYLVFPCDSNNLGLIESPNSHNDRVSSQD
jgi:hypothetical protein